MIETNTYKRVSQEINRIEEAYGQHITIVINGFLKDMKFTMPQIAQQLGIKHYTLKTIIKRCNIPGRGKGRTPPKSKKHLENISKALTGRKLSKAHVEAMRQTKYERGYYTGSFIDGSGYRMIRIAPGKYKGEHRLVMQEYLGRELTSNESVHHIDGDRLNNHFANLALISRKEHFKIEYLIRNVSPAGLRALVATIQARIQPPDPDCQNSNPS